MPTRSTPERLHKGISSQTVMPTNFIQNCRQCAQTQRTVGRNRHVVFALRLCCQPHMASRLS